MLRALVKKQRQQSIERATLKHERLHWDKRISKQGPWDESTDALPLTGAPALPMPVEVSSKESMAPFFAHLKNKGTHEPSSATAQASYEVGIEPYYKTELIEFEKGVLYSDGRLDLCKMVAGPRNIGDLMAALRYNEHSRHFLLGNNIIGSSGAKEIADFIEDLPHRIETWYLAGNCIDADGFRLLVDAMVQSPPITNVWLKRNPLRQLAAKDVARLIIECKQLRTLDLDQTELGDAGVAEIFTALTYHGNPIALRHIYLNACGIGAQACKAIAQYLKAPHCELQSLYLSNNPIGDIGSCALAAGLQQNKSLLRLSLQSVGLKDEGAIRLMEFLSTHPTLMMLDIGQSYATEDLGMRYNWITDAAASSTVELIKRSRLKHFSLSYTPMTQKTLHSILSAVAESDRLVWFMVKPLVLQGGRDASSIKIGQEYSRLYKLARQSLHENVTAQYNTTYPEFEGQLKRFLISPDDVRLIDSVYRNRDAGLARRGLKRLDKQWGPSNRTVLDKVVAGENFD
ncbi:RNI-like protein [Polychaeton citri CBS 116435]|uniref:RNI-like protein n=1 Tax=Polychaeton citri CBS 116435 TaxID=1314669 RepID=A0A9P4UL68_9PEZI|nr:RNI-like protein [Polychaeton citri CBS 116435]